MSGPMYNGLGSQKVDYEAKCRTTGGTWNAEKQQCYNAQGEPTFGGRRNLIGPLKKGTLMGYNTRMKATARRKTLRKVVKKVGPLSTFRKLNAVYVYSKKTAPTSSKIFKVDRDWIGATYITHK